MKRLKPPGESFSDLVLRALPEPGQTCGDVLDGLRNLEVPIPDAKLLVSLLRPANCQS